MSAMAKIGRRIRLLRNRCAYEVRRPRLSAGEIAACIDPGAGVDVTATGGFAAFIERHLVVTPQAPVWDGDEAVEIPGDVDWHLEPHFGVQWPRRFEGAVTDNLPGSDIVLLWHKNKMMPLLDLARRYEETGERRWADACFGLIDSWIEQNPYMVGKSWRSPMEIGTRLVVWSQSLSMLRAAGPPSEKMCERLSESVLRQCRHLAGHFSAKDVPNNHLIGEAAMLYAVATYWPLLAESGEWMATAQSTLEREVERQVLPDGFDYENSVNYHLYVLDFLMVYLHAVSLRAATPPPSILEATARMIDAALTLVSPTGRFPQIGDDSMTEFFALRSPYPLLETAPFVATVGAADLVRPGMAMLLSSHDWGAALLGRDVPLDIVHHFDDAGVTVVRRENSQVTMVSGPQHDRTFSPGHLNLDTGGLELEVDGHAVFVDSGTYLYTYDLAARRHFRGASAHNTVVIDGVDPVENVRVFGWDDVHRARTLVARGFGGGAMVACRREIAGTLASRFVHRRWLVEACGVWVVVDDIVPDGGATETRHEASVLWHTTLPPSSVAVSDGRKLSLAIDGRPDALLLDVFSSGGHDVEVLADPGDMRTWYSRWYGDLQRGATIRTALPVGDGCRTAHVVRRSDVSVRFDGWQRRGLTLNVMTDAGAQLLELALADSALSINGRGVE